MALNEMKSTNSSQIQLSSTFCASPDALAMYTAWFVVNLLCVPVSLSALHELFKKQKKSLHPSHSDIFTSHILVAELIRTAGACVLYYGIYMRSRNTVVSLAIIVFAVTNYGEMFLNTLTCVERYLAVVHPIAYLRLKKRGGVIIRNTCIGFAWLFSAAVSALTYTTSLYLSHYVSSLQLTLFSIAVVSFCTIYTFCVLIRPAPGEGGRDRKSINRSKRAALNTMAFILGAQLSGFVNSILFNTVALFNIPTVDRCVLTINSLWFYLPNGLVLPSLFLHRAKRKEMCAKKHIILKC